MNPVIVPPFRRLRVFAFDPALANTFDTATIDTTIIKVPWEDLWPDPRQPGITEPKGDYLEIIDYDPETACFFAPINFNHPVVLALDGYDPSEGDPRFHQQMVYAVAMKTIEAFELALGRPVFWSDTRTVDDHGKDVWKPTQHLRIYPHGMRDANAYYDPQAKRLVFGYFRASPSEPRLGMPGERIFTCLSHDIIAHETTHAILDGIHRDYSEDSNPDMLAFHEAFSDIVALFQHFSMPDVVRHSMAMTQGDLERVNVLGDFARQFGTAIGQRGSLRVYLGPESKPDPLILQNVNEPHTRGAVLVAAVFQAFLRIYKSRIADLLRIAGGRPTNDGASLHPDLLHRMAEEAAKISRHVLTLCIRALDYCPPVDITFGDFLRALITADFEVVRDDARRYRAAFIESFREWGIFPHDVSVMSQSSLLWNTADTVFESNFRLGSIMEKEDDAFFSQLLDAADDSDSRMQRYDLLRFVGRGIHSFVEELGERETISGYPTREFFKRLGICLDRDKVRSLFPKVRGKKTSSTSLQARFSVAGFNLVNRTTPTGRPARNLILSVIQRRRGFLDGKMQEKYDRSEPPPAGDFVIHGGCTLVFDTAKDLALRYVIGKGILSEDRLLRRREYEAHKANRVMGSLRATYGVHPSSPSREAQPFAHIHGIGRED